jgi:prepilin peptidase CpaA
MLALPASAALWFLPFATPIALWVMWSDMATMRIPNKAVLALAAVFALVGLVALPFDDWLWRWSHLVVVLLIGFILSAAGLLGAGDAKFAAVMAPFIALQDLGLFLPLFAAILLAAFAAHRITRAIPALRGLTPGWASWQSKQFPMGLALGAGLVAYLGLGVLYGS